MKTYQQMAVEVLKARDAHLLKKQRQKALFRIYVPVAASFSFSVLIGLHIWQDRQTLPEIQHIPGMDIESVESAETETEEFMISPSEPTAFITETEQPSGITEETETLSETQAQTESLYLPETKMITENIPLPETVLIIEEQPIPEEQETESSLIIEEQPIPEEQETEPSATEKDPVISSATEAEPPEDTDAVQPPMNQIVLHFAQNSLKPELSVEEEMIFCSTGYTLPEEYVSSWFDTVDVTISYPDGTQKIIEHIGDAYCILNVSPETITAVQFSGDEHYYLFRSEELSEEEFRKILTDSGILQ